MELKVSSPKPESVAPSDCVSDPEEKEVSDDDDDDRNHKHRRREARSQSLERDVSDAVISRPFRKRNKNFGNRHPFRENESLAFETLKNYSDATAHKEFYSKFERMRPGLTSIPRTPLDMSQRLRANQSFTVDPGAGRGRGRESGFWNQRESRFSSIVAASQMVPQGSIPPSLYTGRGLPNVSNAQNASWNTFGLLPAVPNGGLDMLHPMGLQGTLRPPINSSLNVNIPRQRCRDFEERGFCLRGDMCPMEHGVNRIVIEDVQSLSQFNLPVSLPSAHLIGAPAGSGSLHSVNASTTSINNKCIPGKFCKSVVGDDVLPLDGAYPGPGCTSGADLYDPDQPLWNDSGLESSNALLTLQSSKIDDTEPISGDAPDSDCPVGTTRTSVSSQGASSSVWARIGSSKNRFDMKEKTNSTLSSFHYPENQLKEDNDELVGAHSASSQGKQIIADDADPKVLDAHLKAQTDSMRNIRKPSQKALRTLFVNGVPLKSNKREALLAHFKKFGEVIDIYIPVNSERAFVQFSKREEAEAALKAPDAVMGNRFIKLWWANRDSIRNDSTSSGNGVIATPRGQASAFVPSLPVVTDRGKDIHQADASKTTFDVPPPSDQPKPVIADGSNVPPPLQKKLENLEHLKEELRKKQEMLDQKRNEFRRQLNKLEKQATGLKGEVDTEQAAKRPKTASDVAKLASPQSSDADLGMASLHTETASDKNKQLVNTVSQSPKASTTMRLQESTGLKQPIQPLVPVNRYKLDNRPTAFRITPPLPAGLANVAVLKEHFLPYGELSAVEVEHVQANDCSQEEAHITFTTRRAAERAFSDGKCWKDHNLKFMWLAPTNSSNATGSRERSLSAPKEPLDTEDHSEEKLENSVNQEAIVSDGELKHSETKNGLENMEIEPGEDLQSTPRQVSSAKQSPEGNVC
ncbi:zinc finger CCCH domain-containing protein 41 [Gastrolobium bilobum]|uniref:zinc finger CCCH domain-containing protein 41 n=1 Tax=Gastrolobium bilobum TaxID=150636 RepID=UPI002AB2C0B8|nr:zinc finger CCCH domain-containing protein 41 [Gastrolobium bilobum]XP_061373495.1 zinc finger CCCH domain-containing protein 41 [Gastrolobium bilobum]